MITGVTRKAIIELFRTFDPDPTGIRSLMSFTAQKPIGIKWWGNLGEIEFLARLYDLKAMPSSDSRYANASEDIGQHRFNNDDWEDDYVFTDSRFELDTSDTALLSFLAETLHPEVRTDRAEVNEIRAQLNDLLRPDLYELQQIEVISGKPVFGAVDVEPRKITPLILRGAIAYSLWLKGPSAPNLPAYLDSLKAPAAEAPIEPMSSKKAYVQERLKRLEKPELVKLARAVIEDFPEDGLIDLINEVDKRLPGTHKGRAKNLIFASKGLKPEIVLSDSVNNDIKITKNEKDTLIYEEDIDPNQGLSWIELVAWWMKEHNIDDQEQANSELYKRLLESCNEPEKMIMNSYGYILKEQGFHLPALIPQVYLHFDPFTKKQRVTPSPLMRQRMDFLMLLPNRSRAVIELDGIEHYSDTDGKANTKKYAEMMEEDRKIRLAGYDVYRFGGQDFVNKVEASKKLRRFFQGLLLKYDIK
ncbi:MAG TPA: hypothetical protein PLZ58_00455 [Candidatus Saccharibacteria bacterium]|nr:hypothetical protein [Candidatus Saccharibacteria bacterium]HRQ07209.1 hypothetical protein [Candidatus Saccharibacteria bacterium]